MIQSGSEHVVARLILRGEDVEVAGLVSASGDVEILSWHRRESGSTIRWTPTAREVAAAEEGLWEAWGWAWYVEEAA